VEVPQHRQGGDHAELACPDVEVGRHRPGGHRCHRHHLCAVHSCPRSTRGHCSYRRGPNDPLLDHPAGRHCGGYCRVRDWAASRAYLSAHASLTSIVHTRRSGSRRSGSPRTTRVSLRYSLPASQPRSLAASLAWSVLEKRLERVDERFRRLLGHVVPAVDPVASQVRRPAAPDAEHVAIVIFEVVPQ
jgi:hypothetical protein